MGMGQLNHTDCGEGAESAQHKGGNARGKTSERFHFYSPTSAAGARGVYHVSHHISTSKRLHKSQTNISGRWNIYDVQNTFTPQPHVRRRRTWGYRSATSATLQTPLRNLSFACVFPLRRGKLRALTFLYLGECKGENLSQHQYINAGERENLVE